MVLKMEELEEHFSTMLIGNRFFFRVSQSFISNDDPPIVEKLHLTATIYNFKIVFDKTQLQYIILYIQDRKTVCLLSWLLKVQAVAKLKTVLCPDESSCFFC